MTTSAPAPMTARTPDDLLAVVRVVLGFEPADSIVMLTVGAHHPCHGRVDLPEDPGDLPEVADVLLRAAVEHRASGVVLVLYSADHALSRRAARVLRSRFERAGVVCLEGLRADGHRWFPLLGSSSGIGTTGVPYDLGGHRFLVGAVLDGRVLHDSRDALAATVATDRARVAAVERARPADPVSAAWVGAVVRRHAAAASVPSDEEAARLLTGIADAQVRDAAWAWLSREEVRPHVELWSGLVRRCPRDLLPHAAAVLAFLAWLAGDGALAWCAVDRAREVDPAHSLAELVADLIEALVPPGRWEPQALEEGPALGSAS